MNFHPYSKESQLQGHQKPNDTPKFHERRYNRRRRKPKTDKAATYHHGRKVPHWKQRGAISKNERAEALRQWGENCVVCHKPYEELHHVKEKGFGVGGRGKWRNLVPLCVAHHRGTYGVHGHKGTHLAKQFEDERRERFGHLFYADEYDLWMKGLIENPDPELFEKYMREIEKGCADD